MHIQTSKCKADLSWSDHYPKWSGIQNEEYVCLSTPGVGAWVGHVLFSFCREMEKPSFQELFQDIFLVLGTKSDPEALVPRPPWWKGVFFLTKEDFSSAEKEAKMWQYATDNLVETGAPLPPADFRVLSALFLTFPTDGVNNHHVCLGLGNFLGCGILSTHIGKVLSSLPTELLGAGESLFPV